MEFLKGLLSDELMAQLEKAINEHNGNEANKDNQIKLGNLGKGDYISRMKYDDLVSQSAGKDSEIENYKQAIADLQKASKGNEGIQERIAQLEAENAQLKEAQEESDRKHAFDVLLMDAGVSDKDEREFLAYKYGSKLKEEGKTLELDENRHIRGGESIVESLKTMRPKAFDSVNKDGLQVLGNNRLPGSDGRDTTPTREEFLNMSYEQRVALKNSNEQAYKTLAGY